MTISANGDPTNRIPNLPLCVDLDGTLLRTDTLFESLLTALRNHPLLLLRLPGWLMQGRAYMKRRIAECSNLDCSLLPENEAVVAYTRQEKAKGRRTVLVTGTDQGLAEQVAARFACFDEVHGSNGTTNLKGENKQAALVKLFGEGGFDYIGNDASDMPVWRSAATASVAGVSARFIQSLQSQGLNPIVLGSIRAPRGRSLIRAMRPHQWVKNTLIFVPMLAGHAYSDIQLWLTLGIAFVSLSLTASSTYLFNDLIDLDSDRRHKTKRARPFSSGDLGLSEGLLLAPALLAAGLALALTVGTQFLLLVLAYAATSASYSVYLKKMVLLDAFVLAGLYSLRIWMGGVAVAIPVSRWLIAFSVFLFLSLGMAKRLSELFNLRLSDGDCNDRRGYVVDDIPQLAIFGTLSGYLAVLVLALYLTSEKGPELYSRPVFLWFLCLVLLYWVSRIWLFTHRGHMNEDPIIFVLKDKWSYLLGGLTIIAIILAGPL